MRQTFHIKQLSFRPFVVSLIDSGSVEVENLFFNRFALASLRCADV